MNRTPDRIRMIICLLIAFLPLAGLAQGHLEKKISIRTQRQSLAQTLQDIGKKGDFYFSYNSNILKGDSLVDLDAAKKTVRQILDILLGENYEYSESGRYIILQKKVTVPLSRGYTISGWVVDADTKKKISRASIYEADQLISVLTDSNGYFRLRLKEKVTHARIMVSKELYRDTFLVIHDGYDREFTFSIVPTPISELIPFVVSSRVERTWLGHFLLSSRQKIQSLNLLNFFASKPIQFSLTPGLGTHGQMGAQVINKFSLNLLGGYTAGSNGLEMAGLFNIDKKDVHYLQVAGLFNIVGGNTNAVQLAGLHNHVLGSAKGLQAAGVSNIVARNFSGLQLAGIYNHVQDTMKGLQVSGLINRVQHRMGGVQLAGLVNIAKGNSSGVQVGLINIADSSSGYMIGLFNIVRNKYRPLSVFSNEILPLNLSFKLGSRRSYSILLAGLDPRDNEKAYMLGLGLGIGAVLAPKWSFNTELTMQYYYLGNWKSLPTIYRLQTSLQWQLAQKIALFAGPSFSMNYANHVAPGLGYKPLLPSSSYHTFYIGDATAWFGWSIGINFL